QRERLDDAAHAVGRLDRHRVLAVGDRVQVLEQRAGHRRAGRRVRDDLVAETEPARRVDQAEGRRRDAGGGHVPCGEVAGAVRGGVHAAGGRDGRRLGGHREGDGRRPVAGVAARGERVTAREAGPDAVPGAAASAAAPDVRLAAGAAADAPAPAPAASVGAGARCLLASAALVRAGGATGAVRPLGPAEADVTTVLADPRAAGAVGATVPAVVTGEEAAAAAASAAARGDEEVGAAALVVDVGDAAPV